jgi:hypothetical protein
MPRIKPPRPQIDAETLNQVCTLSEASKAWLRGRSTILYSIDRGYLTAAKIGRDWLITVGSLKALYGTPIFHIRR